MKKVLVLGGTGAMGNYLVDIMANSKKWDVWVTSRTTHKSDNEHIHFLQGNARDELFLTKLLSESYDAIVDFMNYDYEEYAQRYTKLLATTKHYIWFSSCRVYADSPTPLTETSPRLLETSMDAEFLATNRYALRKARQEDLITNSGFSNYTIIRPYITYSNTRLQLGIYEKEQWLWRLLKGKSLVINKNILTKTTTLSHGKDVAEIIAQLVGKSIAYNKIIQIASPETKTWSEILDIYLDVLENKLGKRPRIYVCDTMQAIDVLYEGGYNTKYDRLYNRSFDSSKVDEMLNKTTVYTPIKLGISHCLQNFITKEEKFLPINPQFEAYQDILTNELLKKQDFSSSEEYNNYIKHRKTPLNVLNMQPIIQQYN